MRFSIAGETFDVRFERQVNQKKKKVETICSISLVKNTAEKGKDNYNLLATRSVRTSLGKFDNKASARRYAFGRALLEFFDRNQRTEIWKQYFKLNPNEVKAVA
jgi:hypothetical protein